MSHAEPGRPLADLVTDLVGDISGLFRKEIQLAKAEASEKLDMAAKAGASLAVGAILSIGAMGVFLAALVTGLAALLINMGMAATPATFVAGLIVAAVVGAIAWTMISRGLAELKANKLNMQRTTNSIRMDAEAVKEKLLMTYDNKTSADLEREVTEQRNRVEARIGEIKDKLSPGQLLDDALSYTKHGGAHFASNLGSQISANPMPAALVGIGLAWLISSNANGHTQTSSADYGYDDHSYPYARVSGGLKRVSHKADDVGQWWSEFETSTGQRYKAKANELGERAGHFTDEAGKMFGGFIDDAGNRVRDFQDDAGNMLSQARTWADHNWREFRHSVGGGLSSAGHIAKDAASDVMSGTRHLGGSVQQQSDQLSRQIVNLFDQQPLIAGALAFAVGAAVGATLPHTSQEDQLLGEQADKLRGKAVKSAGKLYGDGKEKAADLYEDATEQAGKIYGDVKDKVADIATGQVAPASIARH